VTNYFTENADKKKIAAVLILGLLIIVAYSNSFQAGWHMDDYPNILKNPAVQMSNLDLDTLQRAIGFSRSQGNNLPRPVTNLTFALNWWAHGENVAGYHLVNIVVHFLNALLLFLIVERLGTRPVAPEAVRRHRTVIALVTSLLWALNPIQTQAVTYVVQRYTSLTAFFFLAALYCYIRGRSTPRQPSTAAWWGLAFGSYLLAMGAKENAVIWPFSALLVEFVFFRNEQGELSPNFKAVIVATGALSIVFAGGLLISSNINIVKIITNGFDSRPFSLAERLMTQPRVLLFYISQIFYPIPQRLSLEHDFPISVGLLDPWTTLPAMLAVGLLIVVALASVRKQPITAFAVLFFFLNHAVESSFLPIEMVFEHRNYLPSAFVFWPLVAGGFHLQAWLTKRRSPLTRMLPILTAGIVLVFLLGTITRNMDWQTERSLWVDTYRKAPQSARAAVNLANDLARAQKFDQAEYLYREALDLYSPRKNQFKVVARSNLATMYVNTGQYAKALDQWMQVLSIVSGNRPARLGLANIYMAMGDYAKAEEQIDWLLKRHPQGLSFLNIKAFLLIEKNRPAEALTVLRRALANKPDDRDTLTKIGAAYTLLGDLDKADWFFRQAARMAPRDLGVQLLRLESSLAAGHTKRSNALIEFILGRYALETVWARLDDPRSGLRDPERMRRVLSQRIERKSEHIENITNPS
jgi:tetratricopeptide (TPR) repeat protein